MTDVSGFVIIDKPAGITSHDVVSRLRKVLGTKKIGHAGTLDPMATGVLVIGVNKATKFLQFIVDGKKRYSATIRLGASTSTDDKEGTLLSTKSTTHITKEEISNAAADFVGEVMQVPSSVSAIKIEGERAYDKVRRGETVELKARPVHIYSLEIKEMRSSDFIDIDIDVSCSAGTYIRAIARDLGAKLGVGGHLTYLRRTEVSPFNIDDMTSLEVPEIIPLSTAIAKVLPLRTLDHAELVELNFGRMISKSDFPGVGAAIAPNGEVAAIIENRDSGAQPLTVFPS